MRKDQEMFDLILGVAGKDERIRAVYMNGSRTNANAPKDIFQDYDIVYVVRETGSFIADREWIRRFGDILYMQYPDESPYYPSDKENSYAWLMQFEDGTRMDLTVQTVSYAQQHIQEDKLCRVLLDKDGILPPVSPATDSDHWVRKPTREEFSATCNEFWWCTNNIAKGLWRKEIPYVQDMTVIVRKQLIKMLDWKVGILTNWLVSTGKSSKYLYKWLSGEEWKSFLETYFDADTGHAWKAVFTMCALFQETARYVGECLGYSYNEKEGAAAQQYLRKVEGTHDFGN